MKKHNPKTASAEYVELSTVSWYPNLGFSELQTLKNVGQGVVTLRENWFLLTYLESQTGLCVVYGIHKFQIPCPFPVLKTS